MLSTAQAIQSEWSGKAIDFWDRSPFQLEKGYGSIAAGSLFGSAEAQEGQEPSEAGMAVEGDFARDAAPLTEPAPTSPTHEVEIGEVSSPQEADLSQAPDLVQDALEEATSAVPAPDKAEPVVAEGESNGAKQPEGANDLVQDAQLASMREAQEEATPGVPEPDEAEPAVVAEGESNEAKQPKGAKKAKNQKKRQERSAPVLETNAAGARVYNGEVDLAIAPFADLSRVSQFFGKLTGMDGLKVLSTAGWWDQGTVITVKLEAPAPLEELLEQIPGIGTTLEHGDTADMPAGVGRPGHQLIVITFNGSDQVNPVEQQSDHTET